MYTLIWDMGGITIDRHSHPLHRPEELLAALHRVTPDHPVHTPGTQATGDYAGPGWHPVFHWSPSLHFLAVRDIPWAEAHDGEIVAALAALAERLNNVKLTGGVEAMADALLDLRMAMEATNRQPGPIPGGVAPVYGADVAHYQGPAALTALQAWLAD